jgi:MobA/MobL family
MAIYHFSAKVISRKAGQSSVASAAYNAREKIRDERTGQVKDYRQEGQSSIATAAYNSRQELHDERTGETKDYTRKDGVIFSGIFLPKDAPEWARDRAQLWNKAEAAEHRKDSTIARNYIIALPHELTDDQRRYAIQDFIKENFTRKGYAADLSIHAPDKNGDQRNYHAHILVTDRHLEPDGFAADKSERQLKSSERKAELQTLKESWEKHGNRHLERHGFEPNLDHRSLKAQGIDREPTKHKGPDVCAMEKRGIETDKGERARNIEARNAELKSLKLEAEIISFEIYKEKREAIKQNYMDNDITKKQYQEPERPQATYGSRAGMVAQETAAYEDAKKRQKILNERHKQQREDGAQQTVISSKKEVEFKKEDVNERKIKEQQEDRKNAVPFPAFSIHERAMLAGTKFAQEQHQNFEKKEREEIERAAKNKGKEPTWKELTDAQNRRFEQSGSPAIEAKNAKKRDKSAANYAAMYANSLPAGKELTGEQIARFEKVAARAAQREQGEHTLEREGREGIEKTQERTRER